SSGWHAPADGEVRNIAFPIAPRSRKLCAPNVSRINALNVRTDTGCLPNCLHVRRKSRTRDKGSRGCTEGSRIRRPFVYGFADGGTGRSFRRFLKYLTATSKFASYGASFVKK